MNKTDQSLIEQMRITDFEISSRKVLFSITPADEAALKGMQPHIVGRVNDLVDAIGPHLAHRPDVRHVPIAEARAKMGPAADLLMLDQIVRSPRARALGWTPGLHSVSGNAVRLLDEWRTQHN